jgi:hypothetical protein
MGFRRKRPKGRSSKTGPISGSNGQSSNEDKEERSRLGQRKLQREPSSRNRLRRHWAENTILGQAAGGVEGDIRPRSSGAVGDRVFLGDFLAS